MTAKRPRIALLAAPETSASVLYGLYDVLLSVGAVYPDMTTGEAGDALLDVSIVAAAGEPFRCFGNVLVEPHATLKDADDVDVGIVCDMYTPIHVAPTGRYEAEIDWLRRIHARGATIASVCTGSVLLAESGLLDGRTCAGHWAYIDLFRSTYPLVDFQVNAVLDLASEGDGSITAGGVTAWQDLALHLIARLCGTGARRPERQGVSPGHARGWAAAVRRHDPSQPLGRRRDPDALTWADEHFATENPVTAMAEQSGLTRRTFARRFRAATGKRPIDYVHGLRIERARELIESGSVDRRTWATKWAMKTRPSSVVCSGGRRA